MKLTNTEKCVLVVVAICLVAMIGSCHMAVRGLAEHLDEQKAKAPLSA